MARRVLWLLALMIALLCPAALAESPLGGSGSIAVHIHTAEGVNVPHAQVELFRVGAPVEADGNLAYEPTESFAGSDVSLADLGDHSMAAALEAYVISAQIAPDDTQVTDAQGRVTFADVPAGLYLVRQNGFDEPYVEFTTISGFVVTVPMMNEDGTGWNYHIQAQPKTNPSPAPTVTVGPVVPPPEPELPQTGMLRWPVPVLGVCGLVLFAAGWVLAFGGRKGRDA